MQSAEELKLAAATPFNILFSITSLANNHAVPTDQVLSLSLQVLVGFLEPCSGAICLLDEAADELAVRAAAGGCERFLSGRRFPREEGLIGRVFQQGATLLLEDVVNDPRWDGSLELAGDFRIGSLLCLPLRHRKQVNGVLLLLRQPGDPRFSVEEQIVLRAAGQHLAAAVEINRLTTCLGTERSKNERLDAIKAQFLSLVSHELLTPLTLFQAQLDLLGEELALQLQPATRETLLGMQTALRRLQHVTAEILTQVQLEQKQRQFFFEPTDMADLLLEVHRTMVALAAKRKILLDIVPHTEPVVAMVDRDQIFKVLSELILNAIRFTPDGGRVLVEARSAGQQLLVSVRDTGIGIPSAERSQIFEPLVELGSIENHHTGTEDFLAGGIGLGLSIAREIIRAHGGMIGVESTDGGSRFWFKVPQAGPSGVSL